MGRYGERGEKREASEINWNRREKERDGQRGRRLNEGGRRSEGKRAQE